VLDILHVMLGDYWCDGGFVLNIPLEYALQTGAARIFLLLCIGRSLPRQEEFKSVPHVLNRLYDIMWIHCGSCATIERDFSKTIDAEVHVIEPSSYLEGFGITNLLSFNSEKGRKFMKLGYEDAREQLKTLK
jgi:hypothetical protein